MPRLQILCLSGIWCLWHPHPIWRSLKPALRAAFPEADLWITVEEIWLLHPWQFKRMDAFCDEVARKYDTGGYLLIVGHSMGGVMGYEIARRLRHTTVISVATIFSPHAFLWSVFPAMIRSRAQETDREIPVISFQARYDHLIWWGARHPAAKQHEIMKVDHRFMVQWFPSRARKITQTIRAFVFSQMLE